MSAWGGSKVTTWKSKLFKNVLQDEFYASACIPWKVENQLWKQGFFQQALKYLGLHVFAKASLEDIKRVHLATKDFQKCFYAMVVLCMC